MRSVSLWFLIASLLICGCGSAGERYQPAHVQAVDGEPCFSLGSAAASAKEAPVLSSVRVDERVEGVARNIWQIEFLGQRDLKLSPDECIPYSGGMPDPAPALRPARAYNVTILADVKVGQRFSARWYSADFCMRETEQGLRPHRVEAGGRSGAPGWAECGAGVHW